MSARRISYRKERKTDYLHPTSESQALFKATEILNVIYSAFQTTEKISFSCYNDILLIKQVHSVGDTLARYLTCGPRGHIPSDVDEAFYFWKSLEGRLRLLLLKLEDHGDVGGAI